MENDPQKFLEVALAAVKKAEPMFRAAFGRTSGIEEKKDSRRSKVTDTDKEVEKLIIGELLTTFPAHSIVAEESEARDGSEYTWYIDPIDGTTNYIRGIPHCSISVALWDAHGPLVGVVADPVSGTRYTAIRGGGAFKNGQPLHVSPTASLKQSIGNLGWDWGDQPSRAALISKVEKAAYRWRIFSGSALEICFVASGILDFFASVSIHIWDMAAAILILTEAGGTASELTGADISQASTNVVGTNGKLHTELLAALK